MKIVRFRIKNDKFLEVICKYKWYENCRKEIEKITKSLIASGLNYKYLGFYHNGLNREIIFSFNLLDFKKDIEPYLKWSDRNDRKKHPTRVESHKRHWLI